MLIGLPKEIKNNEYRVGLTPASVHELTSHGHQVLVQTGAGAAIGLSDEQYKAAGATLAADAKEVFAKAEMIVKVKEPQPQECAMLRAGQILYTYLHLAPDPEQTAALIKSGAICIAYETITGPGGGLPLLAPMSEVAGRMAVQAGAAHLEKSKGGRHGRARHRAGQERGPPAPVGPDFWQPHQHRVLQRPQRGRSRARC